MWFQRLQLGASSMAFVILLAFMIGLGFIMVSGAGYLPSQYDQGSSVQENVASQSGSSQIIVTQSPGPGQKNLQLQTFTLISLTPIPPPANANACEGNSFNEEPDIFLASDPPSGGITPVGSQIRVWVDDGNGGSVAPGTQVDSVTGQITPGDRTANDGKGTNYYLWEPAIYLTPLASHNQPGPFAGDVEVATSPQPHFPIIVKGKVSLADTGNDNGFIANVPSIDPPVNPRAKKGHGGNIAEYIWDVNSLGLTPGSGYYRAQIVIHDGDGDLAINCMTIQI